METKDGGIQRVCGYSTRLCIRKLSESTSRDWSKPQSSVLHLLLHQAPTALEFSLCPLCGDHLCFPWIYKKQIIIKGTLSKCARLRRGSSARLTHQIAFQQWGVWTPWTSPGLQVLWELSQLIPSCAVHTQTQIFPELKFNGHKAHGIPLLWAIPLHQARTVRSNNKFPPCWTAPQKMCSIWFPDGNVKNRRQHVWESTRGIPEQ